MNMMMRKRCEGSSSGVVKTPKLTVSDSGFFSKLPSTVSHEIYFKLPIKDVMRCKCVCKEFNELLLHPTFSENYTKKTPFSSVFHCLYPADNLPAATFNVLEISENGDRIRSPFDAKLPSWMNFVKPLPLVGTCNGFLCLRQEVELNTELIYLTNPIMGVPIELPARRKLNFIFGFTIYSLGFTPSTGRFKVLRIAIKTPKDDKAKKCQIITVGVDQSWRPVPNFFTGLRVGTDFVALTETFHWIPEDDDLGFISTFDLTREEFGRIPMPRSLLSVSKERLTLAVLRNRLALVDTSDPSRISIWKLNKYSVAESWTNVDVLMSWFPQAITTAGFDQVTELKNGEMLFSCPTNYLVSCNISHKRCSIIEGDGLSNLDSNSILTYTPNFLSSAELVMKGHSTMNVQLE